MSPAPGEHRRGSARRDRSAGAPTRRYPRTARVNKVLQEILAEALERLGAGDDRLALLTVTDVVCDPDLRAATVLFASLDAEQRDALARVRARLQAEVGRQVRLKRTPLLSFEADPAVAAGDRIEEIIRRLGEPGPGEGAEGGPGPRGTR